MGDMVCPDEVFILVTSKPGEVWKVANEAAKIDGVKVARAVSGRFDVAIYAETKDVGEIVSQVHSIKGVLKSESLIALKDRYV